jgi:hypothetical protein
MIGLILQYLKRALPLLAVLVILAAFAGGYARGSHLTAQRYDLKIEQAQSRAVAAALAIEREQNRKVRDAMQKQSDEVAAVNRGLVADLDELRQRASRPAVPRAPAAQQPGATGAELSREDAGFLAREAARADELRAALRACYDYADTVAGAD